MQTWKKYCGKRSISSLHACFIFRKISNGHWQQISTSTFKAIKVIKYDTLASVWLQIVKSLHNTGHLNWVSFFLFCSKRPPVFSCHWMHGRKLGQINICMKNMHLTRIFTVCATNNGFSELVWNTVKPACNDHPKWLVNSITDVRLQFTRPKTFSCNMSLLLDFKILSSKKNKWN